MRLKLVEVGRLEQQSEICRETMSDVDSELVVNDPPNKKQSETPCTENGLPNTKPYNANLTVLF